MNEIQRKQNTKIIDILLIEDNADDVYLTELAIKESNINGNFLVINNGKTAIQLIEGLVNKNKKLPDIILLDVNLPKVTGIEVLKYIKSNSATVNISTVVFTSSDSIADMKYCYESGADLFVRKPNSIQDLRSIMQYIKTHCLNN